MREFLLCILISIGSTCSAQPDTLYAFFVAGHTSGGAGVNNIGLHPPFKQKFGYLQSRSEIELGVLTGDIVSPNPVAQDWDEVDADLTLLGIPTYFAVGNHDMENRPLFESRYGDTYYAFTEHNDLFIVLDPNLDGWSIVGQQFQFLDSVLTNSPAVDNIFVFFHQLLWWQPGNFYSSINPNSDAGYTDPVNFWTEIEPRFKQTLKPVYLFAGDVGAASWSSDFMYDEYANIHLIASGMGEGDGDNFLVVNVLDDKGVSYDLICLDDPVLECFGDLESYRMTIPETPYWGEYLFHPNPTEGQVLVKTGPTSPTTIRVFDYYGNLVHEEQVLDPLKKWIDLSHLSAGVYMLLIENDSGHSRGKLLVK